MSREFGDYGGFEEEVLDAVLTYDQEREPPSLYTKVRTEKGEEAWLEDGVPTSQQAYAGAANHDVLPDEEEPGVYDDMPDAVSDYFEHMHDEGEYDGIIDAIRGELAEAKERYGERKAVMAERKPVAGEYRELKRKADDGLLDEDEREYMEELGDELRAYAQELQDIDKDLGEIYADIADAAHTDEAADALHEYWSEIGDEAQNATEHIGDTAGDVNDYVADVLADIDLSETAEGARQTAQNTYDTIRDRADDYRDRAGDWTRALTDRLRADGGGHPATDGRGEDEQDIPTASPGEVDITGDDYGLLDVMQQSGENINDLLEKWEDAKDPWSDAYDRVTADDPSPGDVMADDLSRLAGKLTGGRVGSRSLNAPAPYGPFRPATYR